MYRSIVIDITVMRLISTYDCHHITEGSIRWKAPIINSNGRCRDIFNSTLVELLKKLGVGMDGLFLEIACNPMGELGRNEVTHEVGIEEDSLDYHDEGTLIPTGLSYFHECHEVHPLVLRFLHQRPDPAAAVLEAAEGAEVEEHPPHHSWHGCNSLQHHCTAPVSFLPRENKYTILILVILNFGTEALLCFKIDILLKSTNISTEIYIFWKMNIIQKEIDGFKINHLFSEILFAHSIFALGIMVTLYTKLLF